VKPCPLAQGDLLHLDTARVIVDVGEFEDAMRSRDPAALAHACNLYRGEFLEGLNLEEAPFDEWLIGERRRLDALAIDGLNQLLQHQQRREEREAAMQTALRLLLIDPLQESVHRSLMRLYHEIGNAAQAPRQYVSCEKILRRELNVEPEDATKELRREILRSRRVSSSKAESNPNQADDDRLLRSNDPELHDEADTLAVSPRDRPSIAVLPFANLGGDLEQDYFSDGITEDIITELSRFSELFVIARNSSFVYKGKSVDVRQIGRELGVRYVLEGSVRKSGNRVRITGQLVDTTSGAYIWADRFDGKMEDVFDLQDQMSAVIVGALRQSWNVPRSSERDASRPRASTHTITICGEWRAFTKAAGKASPRRWTFSKKQSNSIKVLHWPTRWPPGVSTFPFHSGPPTKRCAKLSDWRGSRRGSVPTMLRPFPSPGL
jgi:TolB-like protein